MLKKHPNRRKNKSSKNFKLRLLVVSTIALAILSGCISQQPEVPEGNPEIDLATPAGYYNATPAGSYNTPAGYYKISEGMFTVINGSIPEVKDRLRDIINKKASQQSTFSINDDLNLVVFRGVFTEAGSAITIDKVEKQGNVFTVYATYIDWSPEVPVVTLPTEIIPIGKLAAGNYEARLRVTKVWDEYIEKGKVIEIERKVVESEKEISVFNFEIKN